MSSLAEDVSILADMLAASIEPVLKPHGLSVRAFDILAAIRASRGRESQAQIAERLEIKPSSLTENVQALIKRGFLMQTEGADRRVKQLSLTTQGTKILNDCLKAFEAAESKAMAGIPEKQLDAARKVIQKALKNLQ
jgi:MarR family transcriptional regulator, transcriptional regulator for hemolysin